jgi:uncharacterized membrane protein
MEVDNRKILIAIIIVTLLLFLAVVSTFGALRIALSVPFVLFFPGYTMLSALFPKRGSLGGIERMALSFGLSIAIVSLIGLILNYTPGGISLYPILIFLTAFILVTSAIAWYRQMTVPLAEQFSVAVNISLPKWRQLGTLDKALSVSLVGVILVALGSLGYAVAMPKTAEKFTEFYILSMEGKGENYPKKVTLGESVELVTGIVNHEYEVTSYRIDIKTNGIESNQITIQPLANEEKWEEVVSFVPQSSSESQRVEFWLYKNDGAKPYFKEPLHLYIDVTD